MTPKFQGFHFLYGNLCLGYKIFEFLQFYGYCFQIRRIILATALEFIESIFRHCFRIHRVYFYQLLSDLPDSFLSTAFGFTRFFFVEDGCLRLLRLVRSFASSIFLPFFQASSILSG